MTRQKLDQSSRVGIIGGGPSGLCMAKHLLESGFSNVTIYEQSDGVGGIWRYHENANSEHMTPMYQNLRVNVLVESMAFLDYPVEPTDGRSYCQGLDDFDSRYPFATKQ